MKEKISTIKNPLTVIAIFAGTAEISGTAILPFLESVNQQTYIWFLMLFPILLIVFFFITLNWNHKVLYAPSDFSNEDNFVNILKKPTIQETLSEIESSIGDEESKESETISENESSDSSKVDKSLKTSKEDREQQSEIIRNIQRQRMRDAQLAELLVLNKLEKEFNSPIQREMKLEVGGSRVIFDGVIQKGSELTGIEVKYMRTKNALNSSMWGHLSDRFENLYNSLNDSQKKSFSIIFAVVTDDDIQEIKEFVQERFKNLNFPVEIRVYDFENLKEKK